MQYPRTPLLSGLAVFGGLALSLFLGSADVAWGQTSRTPRKSPPTSSQRISPSAKKSTTNPAAQRQSPKRPTAAIPAAYPPNQTVPPAGGTTFDELDSLRQELPSPASPSAPSVPVPMEMHSPDNIVSDNVVMDGYLPEFDVGGWDAAGFDAGQGCRLGLPLLRCRLFGAGEVMAWWTKGLDVPPLVTTSPPGTPRDQIGVLGAPGTTILFGGEGINNEGRGGGRATLGYWLNPNCGLAIESVYTFASDASTDFQVASPGTPSLARPFRNTVTGMQDAVQLAIPGELSGGVSIHANTEFQTFDLRFRKTIAEEGDMLVDFLIGYRYAEVNDQLTIADTTTTLVPFPPPLPIVVAGTNLSGIDRFETTNRFNGAQFGFNCELARWPWTWELLLNLAVGNTSSEVFIDGSTRITVPGAAPVNQAGSKLALPSNMGRFQQDSFSVIPEVGLRLNYDFAPRWRMSVGYSLLYWSHVARAGNQIDLDIDENQFPVPNVPPGAGLWPEFRFVFDDFWAQGVGLKLEHLF